MELKEWVRNARKSRGWSQQQLAEQMGREKANISHWETGKHEPSFGQLLRIRDLTGYPLHELGLNPEWPLPKVPREALTSLTPEQLEAVQRGLLVALATARTEDLPGKQRAAGT
jgi:transcriptional regulator with XRE-family HTH domain